MAENLIDNYQKYLLSKDSDSEDDPLDLPDEDIPTPIVKEQSGKDAKKSKNKNNNQPPQAPPKKIVIGNIDPKLKKDDLNIIVLNQARSNINRNINVVTMNDFYRRALRQIITELFSINVTDMKNLRSKTAEDLEIDTISYNVEYMDVKLQKPTITTGSGRGKLLTPQMCRDTSSTYSSSLYINIKVQTSAKFKNGREEKRQPVIVQDLPVGNIPIMIRSEYCVTDNQSDETLLRLGEDTTDHGGYFIIEGIHRISPKIENLVINKVHAYKNEFKTQKSRITFQSKPGDGYEHSYYMVIVLQASGEILIEIVINSKIRVIVPFYILFRALGMTRDQDIVENITYSLDENDIIVKKMLDILHKAFVTKTSEYEHVQFDTNPETNLLEIVKKTTNLASSNNLNRDPNIRKHLNHEGYKLLNSYILPHVGKSSQDRIRKVKYLGFMINKLLLCELKVIPSTDRDHLQNKTIATPSINMAKTTKTAFNFVVNKNINDALNNAFLNNPWKDVDLAEVVKNAVKPQALEKIIIQGMKSGDKTISLNKTSSMANKMAGQQLIPKNQSNIISSLNSIMTQGEEVASKSNERSKDMRMPHSSFLNILGMCNSSDTGDKIGTIKQMTVISTLTEGSNSALLKEIILADPEVVRDVMPREIGENKLWKILVNGDWIAVCNNGEIIDKFRSMRRAGQINRKTIIVEYPIEREISFRTDVGHFIVPYIIVYNNLDEYIKARQSGNKELKFKQWIKLTKEHIIRLRKEEIDIDYLVENEIMEYIGAEESDNMLLCENLNKLIRDQNNVLEQYTHLDIEAGFYGILELASPFSNHTASARMTIFINQKKQSCGWPVLNWFNRYERNMHLQFYCSIPSVITLTSAIPLLPTSENLRVAYMINSGYNQEDSVIVNKSSVDRGIFAGCNFYFEKVELEKGEQFGNPDIKLTINRNTNARHENLVNGFIKEGSIVTNGSVLIVKISKINKDDSKNGVDEFNNCKYIDSSVIYKFNYPSIVEKVTHLPGSNIAVVKMRNMRPISIGDKVASSEGCKGIVAVLFNESQMPFTEDGLIPDMIVNPHSVPTRMVIGQIIETVVATLAAKKGIIVDGSPFKDLDIDAVTEELKKYGINACMHRMYNGKYGNWFDSLIFVGITTYQRLLKFVIDEAYAMNSGPTDAMTRQTVEGKSKGGGLKFGEMEKDVLLTSGSMLSMYEIFYKNSDGIDIFICKTCGNRAIVNQRANLYKCLECTGEEDIYRVPSSFSANLTMNEIESMNVKIKYNLEGSKFVSPST